MKGYRPPLRRENSCRLVHGGRTTAILLVICASATGQRGGFGRMPSFGGPPVMGHPPGHGPGRPAPVHAVSPVIRSPGRTGRDALPTPFIVPYPVFVGSGGYAGALEAGTVSEDTLPDVPAIAPMSMPLPPPPQMPAPEENCGPAPPLASEDDRVLYFIALKD